MFKYDASFNFINKRIFIILSSLFLNPDIIYLKLTDNLAIFITYLNMQ